MISLAKVAGKTINGIAFVAPNLAGELTLDLFCRPKEGRAFKEKELTFLKKSKWTSLLLDGKKIQCYTWGNGPKKVLLAHGFNSNATRWRPLVNLLQHADYQIIALDAPAHGHSDWKRVNGLLYARVVEVVMQHFQPHFVVGHSFAGIAYAYYFSKMEHEPIKGMALLGVPNELSDITEVFFKELGLNQRVQSAYYQTFNKKFKKEVDYFTLSNMLKTVDYPGLIIHDEKDEIASYSGAEILEKEWKNASLFTTKNLGHSLQGRAVYKKIATFLANF